MLCYTVIVYFEKECWECLIEERMRLERTRRKEQWFVEWLVKENSTYSRAKIARKQHYVRRPTKSPGVSLESKLEGEPTWTRH